MLTPSQRLDTVEQASVILANQYSQLPTYDELDAAVTEIWDKIEEQTTSIQVLENNISMIKSIIAAAQGNN